MARANTCEMGVGWVNGGCIRVNSEHDLDGCYFRVGTSKIQAWYQWYVMDVYEVGVAWVIT